MDIKRTKATDSLMNFETVKFFNAEKYEMNRYIEGIRKVQIGLKRVFMSNVCTNFGASFINNCGQLSGCLLAASLVANQERTVGKNSNISTHLLIMEYDHYLVFQVIMFYVQHTSYKSWGQ